METPEFSKENKLLSSKIPEASESINVRKFENLNPVEKTPEELKKISEIKKIIQESTQNKPLEKIEGTKKTNRQETIVIEGKKIFVEYVSKNSIYPAFGYGGGNKAIIREDLPPRISRFVTAHEIYHCTDKAKWGGWVGREIRANIIPGIKDPIGLMATIWATVSDVDRIKFYLKRIKGKH
jgi:hypothetical protein